MADISKEQAVQLREKEVLEQVTALFPRWREEIQQKFVLEVANISFKLGRNAGLEEAEQFFQDNDTNLFWGSQAAGYTESLKDNTP